MPTTYKIILGVVALVVVAVVGGAYAAYVLYQTPSTSSGLPPGSAPPLTEAQKQEALESLSAPPTAGMSGTTTPPVSAPSSEDKKILNSLSAPSSSSVGADASEQQKILESLQAH